MIHHTTVINTELGGDDIYNIVADTWQNNRTKEYLLESG